MKRISIIAALPGELKPLVAGWQKQGAFWTGSIGDSTCLAIAGGMGANAATRACELLLHEGPLDALVSVGWAGALSCGLKPPQAHTIAEVVDARTGERFPTDASQGQRLLSSDRVLLSHEKRSFAERFQTPLVDMEAAAVARIAQQQKLPFYCFKAISDGYTDKLPDFNRFIGPDGQMSMASFAAYTIFHPQYWGALMRLGKNSSAAARNLASLITQTLSAR
jgi:adenosylhomocysteine nucleosidase